MSEMKKDCNWKEKLETPGLTVAAVGGGGERNSLNILSGNRLFYLVGSRKSSGSQ